MSQISTGDFVWIKTKGKEDVMSNDLMKVGIGVVGILIGGIVGYVAHSTLKPMQEITVESNIVEKELTDEDLEALCAELTDTEKNNVLVVQAEVKSLQEQVGEREAELLKLKGKIKNAEIGRGAAKKRWEELEKAIALLQVKLAAAEQERDELKVELQSTLKELNIQVKLTKKYKSKAKKYKRESTENLWSAFQAEAKVSGCDRGTKRRHGKCHESFDLAMTPKLKERFRNCVDTYQAVPVLKKKKKNEVLPGFSVYLNDESRFTEDWYIIFCDPTLPEAKDTDLDDEPSRSSSEDLDDLDINFDDLPEN
jgi:hypothetical protein